MAVLTALLGSEDKHRLPRDLLVLNFGLHYGGQDVADRLRQDLRHLRTFLVWFKVSPPAGVGSDRLT